MPAIVFLGVVFPSIRALLGRHASSLGDGGGGEAKTQEEAMPTAGLLAPLAFDCSSPTHQHSLSRLLCCAFAQVGSAEARWEWRAGRGACLVAGRTRLRF